jgi:hypothetical protein
MQIFSSQGSTFSDVYLFPVMIFALPLSPIQDNRMWLIG